MNFGVTGDAAPNAASSRVARYSCAARNRVLLDLLRLPVPCLLWEPGPLLVGVRGDEAGVDRKSVGAASALCHAALNGPLSVPGAAEIWHLPWPCRLYENVGDAGTLSSRIKTIGTPDWGYRPLMSRRSDGFLSVADTFGSSGSRPSILTVKGTGKSGGDLREGLDARSQCCAVQMIGRDVVVEAEVVKQLSRCRLNAHHRRLSPIT